MLDGLKKKTEEKPDLIVGNLGQVSPFFYSAFRSFLIFMFLIFGLQLLGWYEGTISLLNDVLEYVGAERAAGGMVNTIVILCLAGFWMLSNTLKTTK